MQECYFTATESQTCCEMLNLWGLWTAPMRECPIVLAVLTDTQRAETGDERWGPGPRLWDAFQFTEPPHKPLADTVKATVGERIRFRAHKLVPFACEAEGIHRKCHIPDEGARSPFQKLSAGWCHLTTRKSCSLHLQHKLMWWFYTEVTCLLYTSEGDVFHACLSTLTSN